MADEIWPDGWRVIVPPSRRETAAKLFEEWKHANPELAAGLGPDEPVIDWIRALEGGTLVRYRIKIDAC